MPLFVCDRCGCVDNTTCGGTYWIKDHNEEYFDNVKNGEALCSECAPEFCNDGSESGGGVWHNKFQKEKWDGKTEVLNRNKDEGFA